MRALVKARAERGLWQMWESNGISLRAFPELCALISASPLPPYPHPSDFPCTPSPHSLRWKQGSSVRLAPTELLLF